MMTAEKLDEADALQGQYGKSESINQSINQLKRRRPSMRQHSM